MKAHVLSLAALAALTMASCGTGSGDAGTTADSTAVDTLAKETTYTLDSTSTLTWSGTMLGIKTHTGTMPVTGSVKVKGGAVSGGEFTVNMVIQPNMTDTFYNKDYTKEKLMGHLMSAEFFAADSFPTATFKITAVSGNTATGDLTVRGKTNQETVTDIVVNEGNGGVTATGKLTFNRQKYDVAWSTGSKDAVLSDDIVLQVDLMGKAAQ